MFLLWEVNALQMSLVRPPCAALLGEFATRAYVWLYCNCRSTSSMSVALVTSKLVIVPVVFCIQHAKCLTVSSYVTHTM